MTTSDLAPKDAELIAAFIDRRLPEKERQAFLERLDREEALYEVFVETVRYRDNTSESATVLEHPAWRKQWTLPAAIAALLALAVATPLLIRSLSDESYAEMLVADGRLDPYLGEGWYERPWSVTRGIRSGMREADTAFRIGVRVVDLEIALRTGKLDHARILTGRLELLLGVIEFSRPLRASYSELGKRIEAGAETAAALDLAEMAESYVGEHLSDLDNAYELGKWAEAGTLAARSGNAELLVSAAFRRQLDSIRSEEWTEGVERQLEKIARLTVTATSNVDLKDLNEAFAALIGNS